MFNKVIACGNSRSGIINHLDLRLTLHYFRKWFEKCPIRVTIFINPVYINAQVFLPYGFNQVFSSQHPQDILTQAS